jgi:hypothetical protein
VIAALTGAVKPPAGLAGFGISSRLSRCSRLDSALAGGDVFYVIADEPVPEISSGKERASTIALPPASRS